MGNSSDEEPVTNVKKLTKRAKKIQIQDENVNDWDQVKSAFYEHYHPESISFFSKKPISTTTTDSGSGGRESNPVCLFSDLFCDGTTVLCGLAGGTCTILDVNTLSSDAIILDRNKDYKHHGLSEIRASKVSPYIFFSSSSTDGTIRLWDIREQSKAPAQKFNPDGASNSSQTKDKSSTAPKPILQFDVSCNDQLLCGGTEMQKEDSYLMFWDVRTNNLLGAYWESHADDVTAVRFHPSQVHCLASGSTDGLLNTFNLLEAAEDDALQYSFNTNSSVDGIHWFCPDSKKSNVMCVTHTNEVQVWDSVEGDPVKEISRSSLADGMMRSNQEAVYVCSLVNLVDTSRVGLMTCSLSGGDTRLLELNDQMEPVSRGLFLDQTSVIQTTQYLHKDHRWITFDENGIIKLWKLQPSDKKDPKQRKNREVSGEGKKSKRFKPYSRD